jgi:ethanolamine transporter
MAMLTGYMAGATIVFSIPVGLAMLEKKDHPYMALGVLSGVLSVPIGVLISSLLLWIVAPCVRPVVATEGEATYQLCLTLPMILLNLAPLAIIVALIALGLHFVPNRMIRGFMIFGRVMDIGIKLVVVSCIVEYFTTIFYGKGVFSFLFGTWGFDPIIADERDQLRALEVAGYIGTMLAGAFPMVYLIKKYLARPMDTVGKKMGLESAGAAGLLAAVANILAMFRLVRNMRPKDKVLNIAFAVCAAFLFGDHLAFTANFQPNLIPAVMLGKIGGGVAAFLLAYRLSVPKAVELEKQQFGALVLPGPVPVDHPSGIILGGKSSAKIES